MSALRSSGVQKVPRPKRPPMTPMQAHIIGGLIGIGIIVLVMVVGIAIIIIRATNPALFFEIEHYLTTPISKIS